jgi:hypothetical protein
MEKDKIYEVVHSLRIGEGKNVKTLNRGDEVRSSQLEPGDTELFLKQGVIRDPEAPMTGATQDLAHDRLVSIAQKLGLIAIKGAEYRLGQTKAKGITAFREVVSLDDLEAAIVNHAIAAVTKAASTAKPAASTLAKTE